MIRTLLRLSVASAAMLAVTTLVAGAQDRTVNVFNWSDYIDESIISDFTKETGIKVVYDVFDSNEILETKLLAGGSGYDIVVPTHNFLARQIEAGVFQKLDKSKLPNLSNMWDVISERTAKYDPNNDYSINYMWGTVGLGYNKKKVKEALGLDAITSWDVFFKPENLEKLAGCGVYVLDSPSDIVPTTLKYLGLDPESTSQGRHGEGGGDADGDPSAHPQVPLVRIHQRAGQWRHLPGRRLVGRRLPGPRPRRRSGPGCGSRLRGAHGGRRDVVRPDGHPCRRQERRRGA